MFWNVILFFSRKQALIDISCQLSPKETFFVKCQCLFSGKNKKNIVNLLSTELAQRVVPVQFKFSNYLFCRIVGIGIVIYRQIVAMMNIIQDHWR